MDCLLLGIVVPLSLKLMHIGCGHSCFLNIDVIILCEDV